MRVLALFLLAALHFQVANAENPELKYQTFLPEYKDMKATSPEENWDFFVKIGMMAMEGKNGVKTVGDKHGNVILHYVVHESGKGADSPKAGTQCDCNYKGVTLDGVQFDSSFDRGSPTAFAPDQVIPGWTHALQNMVEGDMWEMYIPAEYGYGDKGSGAKIPGGATLVFVMRLEKIKGETQVSPTAHLHRDMSVKSPEPKYQTFFPAWKDLKATSIDDNVNFYDKIGEMAEAGENGLKTLKDKNGMVVLHYVVHESGKGSEAPKAGTQCDCNYKGLTIDGAQFDSSFDRGAPSAFAPSQVIKGWTEALQHMVEGDMWEMYIPAENGYGVRGAGAKIPGGATLVFVMRLEKIKGEKQTRAEL